MALTIRERLDALASPIPLVLPKEYVDFVAALPGRGEYVEHAGHEWWAASIEGLEAKVRTDLMGMKLPPTPNARYLVALVECLRTQIQGYWLANRDGSQFPLDRLQNGFWIGEHDGDAVFLDAETLGVFAYIQDDFAIERWAGSFRELLAGES